jgi:acetyl esterase/lipase
MILAAMLVLGLAAGPASAEGPAKPSYGADGTVHVPAFDLPPSGYMSKEAVALLKSHAGPAKPATPLDKDIVAERRAMEAMIVPVVKATLARYPVDIVEQSIAGVHTRVVTPKGGVTDKKRVLINLHGGGFVHCAEGCAILESVPIAAVGGVKVISVDYRMAPEHVFPAATEDVVAVYRALLKSYRPSQIGIYGCSAGGSLSGQVAAWLPAHGLPQAGAIGIFGAGASRAPGDGGHLAAYIDGSFDPPPGRKRPYREYFDGANLDDPMVSPAQHLDVLKTFPPTLLITGTRAPDLSEAAYAHSQLIKAGVPGDLIVGEGMSHCYILMSGLPESQDAYQAIVTFFRAHLG